ncbi:MAG: hypothetical protein IKB20_01260 [Clostridia bacterium]|nr:hypothetical protein [Clostridia bacterium]
MKNIPLWQFAGFVITVFLGTLLHFLYGWTGENISVAHFSAVNESTWEHMKILFFPAFLLAIVQNKFFKENYENFWCVKGVGILTSTLLVPVLFYTYNGAFGSSPDWVNIAIFFVSAGVGVWLEARLFKKGNRPCKLAKAVLILLILMAVCFVIFTFAPPMLPLFLDPLTGGYGLG